MGRRVLGMKPIHEAEVLYRSIDVGGFFLKRKIERQHALGSSSID